MEISLADVLPKCKCKKSKNEEKNSDNIHRLSKCKKSKNEKKNSEKIKKLKEGKELLRSKKYKKALECFKVVHKENIGSKNGDPFESNKISAEIWNSIGEILENLKNDKSALKIYLEIRDKTDKSGTSNGNVLSKLKRDIFKLKRDIFKLKRDIFKLKRYIFGSIPKDFDRKKEALIAYDKALKFCNQAISFFIARDKNNIKKEYEKCLKYFEKEETESENDSKNFIDDFSGYSEILCNKGKALLKLKRYEEAEEALEEALIIDPSNAEALKWRGWVFHKCGKFGEELEVSVKAIKINPSDEEAWKIKGNALYRRGEYDKALAAYETSLEKNPRYSDAWHNKGLVLYMLKRYDEAEEAFEKAVKIDPNDEMSACGKSYSLVKLGKTINARDAVEKALDIDQEYPFALYYKGIIHSNLGEYKEALDALEKAIKYDSDHDTEFFRIKGCILQKLGKYEEAKETLENAIQMDRKNASLYVDLGKIYFANGDSENASKYAEETLSIEEKNSDALLLKGQINIGKKNYDEAIENIEKANSSKLGDSSLFLWSAYAKYLRLESLYGKRGKENKKKTEDKEYLKGIFEITGDLEKASKLANKLKEYEKKACILYFLGYFYYQCDDIFTAKEKLSECIRTKNSKVRPRAQELLGYVWNRTIRPSWWNWWLSSPLHTLKKRALFGLILFLVVLLTFHGLFPDVLPSLEDRVHEKFSGCLKPTDKEEVSKEEVSKEEVSKEEVSKEEVSKEEVSKEEVSKGENSKGENSKEETKDQSNETNRLSYAAVIASLILVFFMPNIEKIGAKDVNIEICSPPSIDLFLSPTTMETKLEELMSIKDIEM